MKRNKSNKALKGLIYLLLFVVAIGLIGYVAFSNWYSNNVNNPASTSDEPIAFSVPEGENFTSLLTRLNEANLINDINAVKLYTRLNNIEPSVKAGEYKIRNNVTLPELIQILEKGVTMNSFWVTIREGLRDDELTQILIEEFNKLDPEEVTFNSSEFQNIINNPDSYTFTDEVETFLAKYKPAGKSLIGFLFPDTYNFPIAITSLQVADAMLVNFVTRVKSLGINLDTVDYPGIHGFYEVLTLASIVEKESGGDADRKLVASVFHNRLNNPPEPYLLYLQSDATVNYITKANNPRPTIEQTLIDNPYNTYKYPGLPPTPVSNPGLLAIKATLEPDRTNYYFFRHDMTGQAHFNETYDQHLININQYP